MDKLGARDYNVHAIIYKINNKDRLYSTGNYTQYLLISDNGKESKKRIRVCVCVCVRERVFPSGSDDKEFAFSGSERSPGEGNGYFSCLENPMDK